MIRMKKLIFIGLSLFALGTFATFQSCSDKTEPTPKEITENILIAIKKHLGSFEIGL